MGHLRTAGFTVNVTELPDIKPFKTEHKIPDAVRSCHTALVDGYIVEGHVPVGDVLRLLKERPAVAGIAVPKMPIGSPGMEGDNPEAYEVLTFDAGGTTKVYSTHTPTTSGKYQVTSIK